MGADLTIPGRSYLGQRCADEASFTFTLAGSNALAAVGDMLSRIRNPGRQADDPSIAPTTLLMVDVTASHVDAALDLVQSEGIACNVVILGQDGAPTPGGPDPVGLLHSAHAAWGSTDAARITHLVPMGRPFSTGRPGTPATQLFAARFSISDRPTRLAAPPAVAVHWGRRGADTRDALHVVVPDSVNDHMVAAIERHRTMWSSSWNGPPP